MIGVVVVQVAVLGAGVIGATTAYALAEDGHRVTVIDRQPGAGLETSYANGAQISACNVKPWAGPQAPLQALRWMLDPKAPLRFKPWRLDPPLWRWGLRFLANCTATRADDNMRKNLRVALYSRAVLGAWRQRTNVQYDQVLRGILHIYRTRAEFDRGRAETDKLNALGLGQRILSADECVAHEPALASLAQRELAGGVLSPDDESGDAFRFTAEIARLAADKRVEFRFGTTITAFDLARGRLAAVRTDRGPIEADAFVIALGSYAPMLAHDLGLRLPIYPAKGYSITAHVRDPAAAPTVSILDETRYMVFSRLGDRLRVAGTAEFTGWDTRIDPVRIEPLLDNARETFPDASDYADLAPWCGLRPATPDSVPILGASPIENVFLNTGHGTLGWTMACGSARIIADLIAGRAPEIDLAGLGLSRFG
ncbi:MAG: D-amino acid dehydrogenase [Rhodospirillaceae bacterium]|nr:D-amino acid dehydrogenase [Rhodospirillaceae bacterium]